MYCHKCGKEIDKDMEFCPSCGTKQNVKAVEIPVQEASEEAIAENSSGKKEEPKKEETQERSERIAAEKKIEEMLALCSTEQEFLMLRSRIIRMEISDTEKAILLELLDTATKVRLDPILELAEDCEEIKDSPVGNFMACGVFAGIGLAINYFFSVKWPGIVCCILAVLSIAGTMMDRLDRNKVARQKEAAELVAEYRRQGYKI